MTLVEMLEKKAKLYPEKTALIYKDSKISYNTLYEKSNALGNFLTGINFKKGERVGLLLQKTPEAIFSFLGVVTAGGIVFPIDYNQTIDHIQFILNLTYPSVLIVDTNLKQLLSGLKLPSQLKNIIVVGETTMAKYHRWEEIMAQENISAPEVKVQEGDAAYLNFTSGTTGTPKGAITTHANIYWNTLSSIESLRLTYDDIHLCMFPIFGHPHELFARPLFLGGTIVLIDSISPKSIVRAISDHHVTCMMAAASIYETLIRFHTYHPFSLGSLRIAESGGMHASPTLVQKFKERFKVPIIPVWGSTETTGIALATPIDSKYRPGSMGRLCP